MSRYYRIEVVPVNAPAPTLATTGSGAPVAFNRPNNNPSQLFPMDSTGNPRSLNVEFDLQSTSNGQNGSGARFIRIHGIDPKVISQAFNWNNAAIKVYGGFEKGFPLANLMAPKSGLIISGMVWQPYGNWVGTELSLDIPIVALVGNSFQDANITLDWKKGQLLSDAIANSLSVAFPNIKPLINISPNLVTTEQQIHLNLSMAEFTQYVFEQSLSILGPSIKNYAGVKIGWRGSQLVVTDQTDPSQYKTIAITAPELLGNPVWVDAVTIQIICPMRADIQLFDTVTLPRTPTVTAGSQAVNVAGIQFDGTYLVNEIRHIGNYRASDAYGWSTVITLLANFAQKQ